MTNRSNAENDELTRVAKETLRANDRGGYTVPSPQLYPYQWLWDSGFIALGWAAFDEERAWRELEVLFSAQWANGMVPHLIFHRESTGYFPGPDVWRAPGPIPSSGITQPPVLATVVRRLLERAGSSLDAERRARYLYPKLLAFHRWFVRARDPERGGLYAIVHPWESGLDNSPIWDTALARAPRLPVAELRHDTGHVAAEQRPRAEEYERYLGLVALFRDLDYEPEAVFERSPFKVASVSFNAILQRANLDLLALAEHLAPDDTAEIGGWVERGATALEGLWDEASSFYLSRDLVSGDAIAVRAFEGFMPLFAGSASAAQADSLAATARRWGQQVHYLMPSSDPGAPGFEPRRYWRGPVWLNVNWMLADGFSRYGHDDLAQRLRSDGIRLATDAGMWEYFDPNT